MTGGELRNRLQAFAELLMRPFLAALVAAPVTHGLARIGGFEYGASLAFLPVLVGITVLIFASAGLTSADAGPPWARWASLLITGLAATASIAVLGAVLDGPWGSVGRWQGIVMYAVVTAALAAPATKALERWLLLRRLRLVQDERVAAEHYLASGQTTSAAPEEEALRAVQYEQASAEAENAVREHLPLNPRSAKRVLNHLRLALLIAQVRGVFDDPAVQRGHLAKWVLLTEQWPALGAAVVADPAAMRRLEDAADLPALDAVLREVEPAVPASQELLDLLHGGARLAPVLDRLVRL